MKQLQDAAAAVGLTGSQLFSIVAAGLILIGGFVAARLAARAVARMVAVRSTEQTVMLVRKMVFYGLLSLVVMAALNQAGLELGVLLGAAGVLTVALGFASQTSASNLVSGLFLITERPFVIGDIIQIEDVTGTVLSVDLLSVKLRTFDNLYVRMPNESIIKSKVTNLTHFPIRRFDLMVGVAYHTDLARAREVLLEVAERNPLCLINPEPMVLMRGFGDSSIDMQLSAWAARENWLKLRNGLIVEVKRALDEAGIEIPFPHRTLYAGAVTGPLPLRMVDREPDPARTDGD